MRFGHAFRTLRRRGRHDHAGWDRLALFVGGLVLLTLPLISPLDVAADEDLLSAHMLEHVLLGDAAPALLLLAVRGPLLAFMIPVPLVRFVLHRRALRSFFERLTRPATSLILWVTALGLWHIPVLYDAAIHRPWLHDLEHLSFFAGGVLVWFQLIDPGRRHALSVGQRIAFAGALLAFGQVLTDVLFLSPTLYPTYAGRPERLFGVSPLADQQYAALIMMAEQLLTVGTCIWLLLARSLRGLGRARLVAVT